MARGGINKALVMRARQVLLARGEHPSIDAVRIELGNTGSKTTIHRYLKELEESEAGQAENAASLSEELGCLVGALAGRLQGEADEQVERMRERFAEERARLEEQLRLAEERGRQLEAGIAALTKQLQGESDSHRQARERLQQLEVEQARLLQANQDQATRLTERDEQIRSLEEKHRHSRDALEHYRQASKEQREQEQRRHEAQLQQLQMELRQLQQTLIIKQDEVTQLNRANERLASENGYRAKELGEQRDRLERQAGELATLRTELAQSQAAREALLERLGLLQSETTELKAALATQRQETQALHIGLAAATTEVQLLRQAAASMAPEEVPAGEPDTQTSGTAAERPEEA
ncbi:replication region DNA-binding N-term [Azotobacter beijerinckii]|uniref:Replication region DNA-binding N-term n=1 Tax=Azotobacter beijerinckii TaxID=170623 RepID=A0A1H6RGG0_9GAMM|nr:DNA-binding protein [Azotobacter beijerinckii]SEI54899.1 replication region DNA-binding N-term [Azotobacter beijerinckii]